MIRLRNRSAKPLQLDGGVIYPGGFMDFNESILKYSAVQRLIRIGQLRIEPTEA